MKADDLGPERKRGVAVNILRRGYSAVLLGGVAVIGFISIRFLIELLVMRQSAPVEIAGIPKRLDASMLTTAAAPVHVPESPDARPRGPLAHYHTIPQWFRPIRATTARRPAVTRRCRTASASSCARS